MEIEEDSGPRLSKGNGVPFASPIYVMENLSSKNFSYNKLPDEPLKLTILKLDGSSFGIDVAKSATVGDLKKAIQESFGGPDKVSWSHVWGNFCLCYDEMKLLNDSDLLGSFGIKDSDELHFNRHDPAMEQPRISNKFEGRVQSSGGEENLKHQQDDENELEDEDANVEREGKMINNNNSSNFISRCEFKLVELLCGWSSYSKLTTKETSFEQETCSGSPRINHCCGGGFRNIFQLYNKKC